MTNILINSSGKAYITNGNKVLAGKNLGTKTITQNGTYTASSDSLDGYNSVTVNVSGGSTPTISSLAITPSTSAQTFNANNVDGYKPVTVSAVTSSIDSNISAENIRKDVEILGVTGTYEGSDGSSTKYGLPIDAFMGDITSGEIDFPSITGNYTLNLSGLTSIGSSKSYLFIYKFYHCAALKTINLQNLTSVAASYAFMNAFEKCTNLTTVNLSKLRTLTGSSVFSHAFYGCTNLTSISLPKLTSIPANGLEYAFAGCTNLSSINLSNVTTCAASGLEYAFQNCTNLTTVNLSKLTGGSGNYILRYVFSGCTKLATVTFSALTTLSGSYAIRYGFNGCTSIKDVYFPALTTNSFGTRVNQFQNLLNSTRSTITHTLHFPSNLESKISSLTGYPTFGGTSGYVTLLFDLAATS